MRYKYYLATYKGGSTLIFRSESFSLTYNGKRSRVKGVLYYSFKEEEWKISMHKSIKEAMSRENAKSWKHLTEEESDKLILIRKLQK